MVKQATIKNSFLVEGKGLHTGKGSKLIFYPAPVNTGIVFVKEDVEIPALYNFVCDTNRRVILENKGKKISTVEHLLSALYSLGISNLYIHVIGEEIPILDGSAQEWIRLFMDSGINLQDAIREEFVLKNPLFVKEKRRVLFLFPSERFEVLGVISFPNSYVKWQRYFLKGLEEYYTEIAPARTFGFHYEVEELIKRGLIGGADLNNALLIGEDGYINEARFSDEPVRHKVLDIIGDFSLLGKFLRIKIISIGSGHSLHIKALEILDKMAEGGKEG